MKEFSIYAVIGVIGGYIARLFGGWDSSLTTLVMFMTVDYITGMVVAAVFHNSKKTENGALESRAGLKGLCRKGVIMLVVLVACRLDIEIGLRAPMAEGLEGSSFIRDATVIAFIANETISIIENAGLMGVPIPAPITQAIDILRKKEIENRRADGNEQSKAE